MSKETSIVEKAYKLRKGEGRYFLLLFSILFVVLVNTGKKVLNLLLPFLSALRNRISDGYWLVFLSPIVLLNWIVGGVVLAASLVISCLPIAILLPPVLVYSALLELPADFINKKEDREPLDLSEGLLAAVVALSMLTFVVAVTVLVTIFCP